VGAHPDHDDPPERVIGDPVPAPVQAVPVGLAGGGRKRCHPVQPGEGRLARQALGVVPGGDQQDSGEIGLDVTRRVATEAFGSLQRSTFSVLANDAAAGLGGPCFGDSGSPHLLPGSVTTIGVTKAVLGNCNTAVPVTLVDTPEARSFLAAFVTVS